MSMLFEYVWVSVSVKKSSDWNPGNVVDTSLGIQSMQDEFHYSSFQVTYHKSLLQILLGRIHLVIFLHRLCIYSDSWRMDSFSIWCKMACYIVESWVIYVRIFGCSVMITAALTILTPICARTSVWLLVAVRILEGVFEGILIIE
jgi:hypothetical protein